MKRVFIVGASFQIAKMFEDEGYCETDFLRDADFVQFTGGEDVSPYLYHEEPHPHTFSNPIRDGKEIEVYNMAQSLGIPCLGICRGAQFLNVMNGGRLFQHVNNHALAGTHACYSELLGRVVNVTSTHHQMMDPAPHGQVDGWAWKLASFKERVAGNSIVRSRGGDEKDVEVVYYDNTSSLCFQPHPEYTGADDSLFYYMSLINHYFN